MMKSKRLRDAIDGCSMLFPTIVGVLAFFAFPLGYSLYLSFTNANLLERANEPARFISVQNYLNAFQSDVFQEALGNTAWFAFFVLVFSILPALLLAVLINEKIWGQSFFRSIYFVPVVASVVGVSLVWKFLLNKDFGWINLAIEWFGGITGLENFGLVLISWLGNAKYALTAVTIVFVWKTIGYNMVIFMSGLQAINKQLY